MDAPGRDEEAAIVYTSAMAGTPLGAVLTHRNLLANAHSAVEALALDTNSVSLALLPFAHLFGFTVSLMAPLLAGGRVITMARFNPIRALETIRTEGVTFLTGVPSVFEALLAALSREGGKLGASALTECLCGGAPLSVDLQRRWESATGVPLRQGYGLTEAGPVCLFNRPTHPNRLGTLGTAFPGVEVALHNHEICVRGENVFPGYLHDDSTGLIVNDGWLHTGDRGKMDADGYVTFTGVMKAMFTRNGFNIYPREIERVVSEMPGVKKVTVRAIPDAMRENDIAIDITGTVTEENVHAWCRANLAVYKQPSRVEIKPA
jgi:long-chain acyl-CoA synthetase